MNVLVVKSIAVVSDTRILPELINQIDQLLQLQEIAALQNPQTGEICIISHSAKEPGMWQYTYFHTDGSNHDVICAKPEPLEKIVETLSLGYEVLIESADVTKAIVAFTLASAS